MSHPETNAAKTIVPEQLPQLNAEQAKAIFALLELAKQLEEARSPSVASSTPSGMIPVFPTKSTSDD